MGAYPEDQVIDIWMKKGKRQKRVTVDCLLLKNLMWVCDEMWCVCDMRTSMKLREI